jgi:hypothetical protein
MPGLNPSPIDLLDDNTSQVRKDLNPQPMDLESTILPIELRTYILVGHNRVELLSAG